MVENSRLLRTRIYTEANTGPFKTAREAFEEFTSICWRRGFPIPTSYQERDEVLIGRWCCGPLQEEKIGYFFNPWESETIEVEPGWHLAHYIVSGDERE